MHAVHAIFISSNKLQTTHFPIPSGQLTYPEQGVGFGTADNERYAETVSRAKLRWQEYNTCGYGAFTVFVRSNGYRVPLLAEDASALVAGTPQADTRFNLDSRMSQLKVSGQMIFALDDESLKNTWYTFTPTEPKAEAIHEPATV